MRVKLDAYAHPLQELAKAAEAFVAEGNRPRQITVNPSRWEWIRIELMSYGKHSPPAGGGFDLFAESWEPGDPVKIRTALCGFVVAIAADPTIPRDEVEFS